jgi:3-oxo-5-alpha-steroid 4-dehydrogenase 1
MTGERLLFGILLAVLLAISVVTFLALHFVSAPYGRHGRGGWGKGIGARWGWLIMESPAVLVIALCFVVGSFGGGGTPVSIVSIIFLAMWELHYVQRTFIFPFLMRGGGGGGSGRPFPLLLVFMAMTFNTINGYLNGRYLFHFAPAYGAAWIADPRFIVGLALFLVGFVINLHADHVLRHLRVPGESDYKIPKGGLFEYVSSANYFGELVEWTGWAVATWSLPGLAFAVFTAANLIPRARSHHAWYRSRFPDYPKRRKAILPFIY